MTESTREVLLSDRQGVHIPRLWLRYCYLDHHWNPASRTGWIGLSKWAREVLEAGPDGEFYWEAWDTATRNVRFVSPDHTWWLEPDGDLFVVRDDHQYEDDPDFSKEDL